MIAGHVSFHLDFLKIKLHDRQIGGGGNDSERCKVGDGYEG